MKSQQKSSDYTRRLLSEHRVANFPAENGVINPWLRPGGWQTHPVIQNKVVPPKLCELWLKKNIGIV